MRFVCDSCQAKYSIADERIENKVVQIKCQKCGHEITVRGPVTSKAAPEAKKAGAQTLSQVQPIQRSKPVPDAFGEDEDEEPRDTTRIANLAELDAMRKAALAEATGPRKISQPVAAPPPATKPKGTWMVLINNEQKGPFSADDIRGMLKRQEVNPRTYVWKEGMAEWARLSAIPELAPPAAPPPPSAPTATPVKTPGNKTPLAVADLVDPRLTEREQTKPAFDTRAIAKKKTEPAAAPQSGNFDELFGPQSQPEAPAPFDPTPVSEPVSQPMPAQSAAPGILPREETRAVINAAGLVERKRRQKLYLFAALGTVALLVLLIVLDLSGVITIPAFGNAYNLVGIENPHKDAPPPPQYSDQLTEEERKRIREGLMGKKPEQAPEHAPTPSTPTPAPAQPTPATPAPKPEDAQLQDVMGSKLEVKIEAPKLRTPGQDLPKGLDAEAIGKVVADNQAAVKACFEKSLKRGLNVGGRLEIEFSVLNTGNVGASEVKSAKHKGTDFADCVSSAVKAWKFPRFNGDPVTVEYPFILSTGP